MPAAPPSPVAGGPNPGRGQATVMASASTGAVPSNAGTGEGSGDASGPGDLAGGGADVKTSIEASRPASFDALVGALDESLTQWKDRVEASKV